MLQCCKYRIYDLIEININLGLIHILNAYFFSTFYKVNDEDISGVRSKNEGTASGIMTPQREINVNILNTS